MLFGRNNKNATKTTGKTTTNGADKSPNVVPVYLKSADHGWIPALQLKTFHGKATVAVPRIVKEADLLDCNESSKQFKFDNQVINLSDYKDGMLPLQNVDHRGNLEDYKDMVDLPFMREAAILYNLKLRHLRAKPYTRTGDIVIAVNPYQWYDQLYTEEKRCYYSNRLVWDKTFDEDPRATLEPHVYEVSALAYKGLALGDRQDQSILVSGESGAGKTETVKICLNHIASVQRGQVPPGYYEDNDPVVRRVVESNPLLEAFGNAKTIRNDNSSRFGKYLQLQFEHGRAQKDYAAIQSAGCGLAGSKCDVYLLEKNRVISHVPEERTFHIFYQLLAADETTKAKIWPMLRNKTNTSFKYVGHTNTTAIEGTSDADKFQETLDALALVGIDGAALQNLMQAICIVLQLGNLTFDCLGGDADKSKVAEVAELSSLASLAGVSSESLSSSLTSRTFKSGKDTYTVNLNVDQAQEARDALAKEVYEKAFLWLVAKINVATAVGASISSGKQLGTIGLLDIFGFESFAHNRFEQLCINYANEKLQQKFNKDVFTNVQNEYKAEGISLEEIKFDDNAPVLDLIEGRTGLLNILNEECIRPKGNDLDYVHKALRTNKVSKSLFVHRTDRLSFGIHHYAGPVMYDAEFFVAKNLDTLPTDLDECIQKSSNNIINSGRIVHSVQNGVRRMRNEESNIVAPTVWTKYKNQLSTLMASLYKTKSRYIRCIKPNTKKAPSLMEHKPTIEQLQCAGVVAGITIARSSFPNSLPNSVILARYSNLWDTYRFPSKRTPNMTVQQKRQCDCDALMQSALESLEVRDENGNLKKAYAVGKTKTYFRAGALELLEAGRCSGFDDQATIIQRAARAWLSRNCGQSRKSREAKEMEEKMRRAARLAEAERLAKIAAENEARRNSRRQALSKLMDEAAALGVAQSRLENDHKRNMDAADGTKRAARQELERMRGQFLTKERAVAERNAAVLAEQEKRIEEAKKLINYLKKENYKEAKKKAKAAAALETARNNNKKLHGGVDSIHDGLDNEGKRNDSANSSRAKLMNTLLETKQTNKDLMDELAQMQAKYLKQAQARLRLQKVMASTLSAIQEKSNNKDIIEDTIIEALKAENAGKAVMARLDVETMFPDLMLSDLSGSSDTDSD